MCNKNRFDSILLHNSSATYFCATCDVSAIKRLATDKHDVY